MAAFAFRRPSGIWSSLSGFSSADAADFDLKLTKCLNAAEGGAWSPTDVISIGGEGVEITTKLQLGPDATFSLGGSQGVDPGFYIRATSDLNKMTYTDMPFVAVDDVVLGGGVGGANIEKVVRVYGRLLIPTSTNDSSSYVLNCAGPSRFGQNATFESQLATQGLRVYSGTILEGTVTALGVTSFELGATNVSIGATNMIIGGNSVLLQGPWDHSGAGGRVRKRSIVATQAIASYNAADYQWVIIPSQLLSQNATYNLFTVDLGNGDTIGFSNQSSTYDAFIVNPAGDTIVQIYAKHWARIEMVEGVLTCVEFGSFLKHGTAD